MDPLKENGNLVEAIADGTRLGVQFIEIVIGSPHTTRVENFIQRLPT
jgi:hypothetical protein